MSQTTSEYSRVGRISEKYIFSRQERFKKNLSDLRIPISRQAFVRVIEICAFHFASEDRVRPRCLWVSTSLIFKEFIIKGGCCGLRLFLLKIIDSVFSGLNDTSQDWDHECMVARSLVHVVNAEIGSSTKMLRLVLSAKSRMFELTAETISLI